MSLQKTGRGATKKNIGIAKSEAATQYACIVKTNRQHICYQTPVNDSQKQNTTKPLLGLNEKK